MPVIFGQSKDIIRAYSYSSRYDASSHVVCFARSSCFGSGENLDMTQIGYARVLSPQNKFVTKELRANEISNMLLNGAYLFCLQSVCWCECECRRFTWLFRPFPASRSTYFAVGGCFHASCADDTVSTWVTTRTTSQKIEKCQIFQSVRVGWLVAGRVVDVEVALKPQLSQLWPDRCNHKLENGHFRPTRHCLVFMQVCDLLMTWGRVRHVRLWCACVSSLNYSFHLPSMNRHRRPFDFFCSTSARIKLSAHAIASSAGATS